MYLNSGSYIAKLSLTHRAIFSGPPYSFLIGQSPYMLYLFIDLVYWLICYIKSFRLMQLVLCVCINKKCIYIYILFSHSVCFLYFGDIGRRYMGIKLTISNTRALPWTGITSFWINENACHPYKNLPTSHERTFKTCCQETEEDVWQGVNQESAGTGSRICDVLKYKHPPPHTHTCL